MTKHERNPWTGAEVAALRSLYSDADKNAIRRAIPDRSPRAIRQMAYMLGLRRGSVPVTAGAVSDADDMADPFPAIREPKGAHKIFAGIFHAENVATTPSALRLRAARHTHVPSRVAGAFA